jgi:hypothetical protein
LETVDGEATLHSSGDVVVVTEAGFVVLRNVASRRRYPASSLDLSRTGFPSQASEHAIHREEESGVRTFGAFSGSDVVVAIFADGGNSEPRVVTLPLLAFNGETNPNSPTTPEHCTAINALDHMLLVGTSAGRIFAVPAVSGAAYLLESNKSFIYGSLFGIYSSGVKALGLSSAAGLMPFGEVIRMRSVDGAAQQILALGSTGSLALWVDYKETGKEREVWRISARQLIETDMGSEVGEVLDVLATPPSSSNVVTFLVLSLMARARGSGCDMVLHVFEAHNGEAPHQAVGRVVVTDYLETAPYAALHLDRENMSYYVSWSRETDESRKYFAAHVDLAMACAGGASSSGSGIDILHGYMPTLDAEDVSSVQSIRGASGVCYLSSKIGDDESTGNGIHLTIMVVQPPVAEARLDSPDKAKALGPASPVLADGGKYSVGRKRALAVDATAEGFRKQLGSVLDGTIGEAGAAVVLTDLLEMAAQGPDKTLTPTSASYIVAELSTMITEPYGFGHNWGSDGGAEGEEDGNASALYDTIHRLLASKVSMHLLLL